MILYFWDNACKEDYEVDLCRCPNELFIVDETNERLAVFCQECKHTWIVREGQKWTT